MPKERLIGGCFELYLLRKKDQFYQIEKRKEMEEAYSRVERRLGLKPRQDIVQVQEEAAIRMEGVVVPFVLHRVGNKIAGHDV